MLYLWYMLHVSVLDQYVSLWKLGLIRGIIRTRVFIFAPKYQLKVCITFFSVMFYGYLKSKIRNQLGCVLKN